MWDRLRHAVDWLKGSSKESLSSDCDEKCLKSFLLFVLLVMFLKLLLFTHSCCLNSWTYTQCLPATYRRAFSIYKSDTDKWIFLEIQSSHSCEAAIPATQKRTEKKEILFKHLFMICLKQTLMRIWKRIFRGRFTSRGTLQTEFFVSSSCFLSKLFKLIRKKSETHQQEHSMRIFSC